MKASIQAVGKIEGYLREYAGGGKNTEALLSIAAVVRDIQSEAGDHSYVREKLVGLWGWVDKLYSSKKHVPWGVDRIKQFALGDCYRLRSYLNGVKIEDD